MRKRMFVAAVCGLLSVWPAVGQDERKPVAKTTTDGLPAYRTARKLADAGERVVLVLGDDVSLLKPEDKEVFRYTKYTETEWLKSQAAGVYDCWKGDDGLPKMERRVPPAPVRPSVGLGLGVQFTGPLGNTICVGRS